MTFSRSLFIFIKNPVIGLAKTRIAAQVGDERALDIYRYLLSYTKEVSAAVPSCRRLLFYSHLIESGDAWKEDIFTKQLQQGRDLEERLINACGQWLSPPSPTLIIGSDCPYITVDIIEQAFFALQAHDTVLGPSKDGGYYLIGLKQSSKAIFQNVRWSSQWTLEDTLHNIGKLGLTTTLLPSLSDIDTIEDWNSYLSEYPNVLI